ncbi:MAG: hypothetical protein ACHQ52_03210 [Candidatus Eisenbacteria bacterium]
MGAAAVAAALAGAWLATRLADPYANPDSHAFEALARSLLAGHGLVYREPMLPGLDLFAFRSPGYGVFLAGALALGGVRFTIALQGALTALWILLWADFARRLGGRRAGLWTAIGALGLGLAWRFAGQLMTETLYATLLALAVWLGHVVSERTRRGRPPGAWAVLALGATLAAAVLTRPSGFALVGACLVVALASPAARRGLVPALLVALVLWSPWPLRNARVLGAAVPSLTSGGINAWDGATGRRIGDGWKIAADHVSLGELGLDRMFWRLAREEVRAHPLACAGRLARRVRDTVLPPAPWHGQWTHALLWGPALAGLALAMRRVTPWSAALGWPLAVWAAHGLLAAITVTNDRYRFPSDGVVLALGGLGIEALIHRFGATRGALAAAGCVAAGLGLALLRHAG